MEKSRYPFLLVALFVFASGCNLVGDNDIEPSGDIVLITTDFEDFDSVDISHAFEGVIENSDDFSSSVEIDKNLEEYLRFRKIGTTLEIGLESGVNFSGDAPTFIIRMPKLLSYDGSGATKVNIEEFTHDGTTRIDLSGASELIGDFETVTLDLDVSGASKADLSGAAQSVLADLAGASNAQLDGFIALDAEIDLSGASSIYLNMGDGGTLQGEASGASSVRYKGEPGTVNVSTSGASTVTKDD